MTKITAVAGFGRFLIALLALVASTQATPFIPNTEICVNAVNNVTGQNVAPFGLNVIATAELSNYFFYFIEYDGQKEIPMILFPNDVLNLTVRAPGYEDGTAIIASNGDIANGYGCVINRTFRLKPLAPTIFLTSPQDNATISIPEFAFNATDDTPLLNCTLWLDNGTEAPYGTNESVAKDTPTLMAANEMIKDGLYLWWISCSNGNYTGQSEKRALNISFRAACYGDSDCGNASNEDFCLEGSLYRNLTAPACISPGGPGAYCRNTTNTSLLSDCNDSVGCTIDSCNNASCAHTANDSFCDDSLWCNGVESCDIGTGCQPGIPVNCSSNDLPGIGTCENDPDGIPYTFDFRMAFTSLCDEEKGSCTLGNDMLAHTCSISQCNAECEADGDCDDSDPVTSDLCLGCACSHVAVCTDSDGDGCNMTGGSCGPVDCNDEDASIHPGADDSICDGVDNDCDGSADEDYVSAPTSCGAGACAASGSTSCVAGSVIDSCTAGAPSAEACNGLDDDCDSTPDNGLSSTPSTCGIGACASAGTLSCVGGAMVDSCQASAPTFELPGNGIDEDCNGVKTCDSQAAWKNHGEFVSCVTKEASLLLARGLITPEEKGRIVSGAANSDVGKK